MSDRTNPITPAGFAALRARYEQLFAVERPAIVEVVSWAAGNGDRSENGDYIYGRQKLRAIDRELGLRIAPTDVERAHWATPRKLVADVERRLTTRGA